MGDSRIIDKLRRFFLGKNPEISLENRLFTATVVIGEIIALSGLCLNLVFDTHEWVIIWICTAVLITVMTFHYFIKYRNIVEPFKIPVSIISFTGMAVIWLNLGTIDAPTVLMAMVVLMANLAGAYERKKITVLVLYIAMLFAIHIIQIVISSPVYLNPPDHSAWRDSLITTTFCAVFVYMIIAFLEKEYNSEKRRAEKNERKFQSLAENSKDYIIRFDKLCRLMYANRSWKEISGFTGTYDSSITLREIDFISGEQLSVLHEMIEHTFNTCQPCNEQFSKSVLQKTVHYDCRLFPEFDEKQNVISVFGVFRDITDLKNSELELMKLNDDKDKFISTLAHDLKSPFQSILGFLEILKDNFRDSKPEVIQQELGYIYDAAKNHYNLLDDLLAWSISNSGKIPFNPVSLNLNKVCMNSLESLHFHATKKKVELQVLVDAGIWLSADESMLKTILRNLISNAIKFSNKGGSIRIDCKLVSSKFEISVADNGVGIDKARLERLFEPTRFNTTKGTADEKGTGLGLLLCKEFVEKHGGIIWVTSEVNIGSEFRFTIPVNPVSQ